MKLSEQLQHRKINAMKKNNLMSLCLAACLGIPIAATIMSGCAAGDQYSRSTGEYIDDKALTRRVNGALDDSPQYKLEDVDVKSYRGNVQLSGFVNSEEQKERAGEIARTVEGVLSVANNISIKAGVTNLQPLAVTNQPAAPVTEPEQQ
jgi:hyperosmotically inducible protein